MRSTTGSFRQASATARNPWSRAAWEFVINVGKMQVTPWGRNCRTAVATSEEVTVGLENQIPP
jgi:hypothetical protein